MNAKCDRCGEVDPDDIHTCEAKAGAVQRREWVDLDRAESLECLAAGNADGWVGVMEATQAKLREKNAGAPPVRTEQQIVDQTEGLAVWLLSWCFNHQPETSTPMRKSTHPFAERCWAAACHIQEMLTATDPENAVAELDGKEQP
jgi:hypothetical protein